MTETPLQSKITKWLRSHDVYVLTTRVLPGVPVGCPDVIGLYENKWLAIEVKKGPKAPFRPGQKPTLQRLKKGNTFVYVANPENWDIIKDEIVAQFL
ncbi:MAG: hypothetical protein ACR2FM_04910 [Candidatus Saccharimonadales bacterium]